VPNSPSPSERRWTKHGKIIDAGRTISYVLNFGVIKLNLTNFQHNAQIWLPINALKSKLQCSNLFQNARAKSEGGQFRYLQKPPKLIGYHSNIPLATTQFMSV